MPETMLVRIKPRNNRDQHVILHAGKSYPFTKARGWHEVPVAIAKIAEEEQMSDLKPDSPKVFDVKGVAEAQAVVKAEVVREEPAGTPDRPHVVKPQDMGSGVEAQAPAKKRGR
jgi:hypothetical protein